MNGVNFGKMGEAFELCGLLRQPLYNRSEITRSHPKAALMCVRDVGELLYVCVCDWEGERERKSKENESSQKIITTVFNYDITTQTEVYLVVYWFFNW